MTGLCGLLVMVCILATPILTIIFVLKWIRKKPKKKIGIATIATFVGIFAFTLLGVAFDPSTNCEHQYEVENKIEATCTEGGYTPYRCPKCDDVEKKDKVVALGHEFLETSIKEATEDADGEIAYECSICNERKTSVLEKLPTSQEKITNEISSEVNSESTNESKTKSSGSVDTSITYEEIYTAYKQNELRADEIYQRNRYRVTAKINGMETGGLFNLTGGATLTMEIKIGNTIVFFYAEFEKEQEEKLKNVNVGDTITFDGKCLSAGTWTECEIINE